MTILVTGACGFIGSYLIPTLLEKGHEVAATDRGPEPEWIAKLGGVTYYQVDMGSEAEIQRMMGLVRPQKVVHLASILVGPCEADPLTGFRINFMSTAALLDACHAHGGDRFIMSSAGAVFGKGLEEPVANDAIRVPDTVYGQTKVAGEQLLEWYRRVRGLECGAVRFPWVYGPGRSTGLTAEYSSKLLDQIAAGEKVVIDNPDEKGDWLFVKDAVKSIMLLLERDSQPAISYNIMGELHTIRDAMEVAKSLYPEAEIEIRESAQTSQPYASAFDDSQARKDIGWAPDYSLADGIRAHVETLRAKA